jgi:hypothetical protein
MKLEPQSKLIRTKNLTLLTLSYFVIKYKRQREMVNTRLISMKNKHTFLKFKELTENASFNDEVCQKPPPNEISNFRIENAEHCRLTALSEILNIPHFELLTILISNALGDAHEGFLSAFCNHNERDIYNQKLKLRVKELLSLS